GDRRAEVRHQTVAEILVERPARFAGVRPRARARTRTRRRDRRPPYQAPPRGPTWFAAGAPPAAAGRVPLADDPAAEARKATAAAISSGCPRRRSVFARSIFARMPSTAARKAFVGGVSTAPGEMTLQRMPRRPYSAATFRVSASRPALA